VNRGFSIVKIGYGYYHLHDMLLPPDMFPGHCSPRTSPPTFCDCEGGYSLPSAVMMKNIALLVSCDVALLHENEVYYQHVPFKRGIHPGVSYHSKTGGSEP